MNELEQAARPYLASMIKGESCILTLSAQEAIAAWATKTCLAARCIHAPADHLDERWTRWLYEHRAAIPGWHVWAACYVGVEPIWYDGRDVRFETWPTGDRLIDHGVLATLAIGYAVVQVLGLEGVAPPEPPGDVAVRIWPSSNASMLWPPPYHLDDAGLPWFARRFLADPAVAT